MRKTLLALLLLHPLSTTAAQTHAEFTEVHLDSFFLTVDGPGTFVLLHDQTGRLTIHNPERAKRRFIPASTFKIPNALIALETGVADGPGFTLKRDTTLVPAQPFWPRSWKTDHSLQTAFQNSVYWYYQEIARRIGNDRMQQFVDAFDYGNRKLTPSVDTFWLDGDIRISPLEQVDFLKRFYHTQLGISNRATGIVKEIMKLESGSNFILRGKTGTAEVTPTRELGWLVGYLERGKEVYFYALNMEGERVWEEWPPRKRKQLVIRILRKLGAVQSDTPRE